MKGGKPKPASLRLLEGNPGHRPINESITPKLKLLEPPEWLDEEAKAEWSRVAPDLYDLGILTSIDQAALEAYCITYSHWKKAMGKAELQVYKTEGGYAQINPYISIANKYLQNMKAFLIEFGMTPSSRTKIHFNKGKNPDDEMEKFLNGLNA